MISFYDCLSFLQNLTMHRLSAAKACFLSESTGDVPEPEVLIKLLDQVIEFSEISFYFIMYYASTGCTCDEMGFDTVF